VLLFPFPPLLSGFGPFLCYTKSTFNFFSPYSLLHEIWTQWNYFQQSIFFFAFSFCSPLEAVAILSHPDMPPTPTPAFV
jgi:hypothetical protein